MSSDFGTKLESPLASQFKEAAMSGSTIVLERNVTVTDSEKKFDLQQLQKSLREEAYERCPFWIKRALHNGATKNEITWAITKFLAES